MGLKESLREKQDEIDKEYAIKGFTEEILIAQAEVNRLRCENDIVDEKEIIYDKYVQ